MCIPVGIGKELLLSLCDQWRDIVLEIYGSSN